jgi:hypothetical protein
MEDGSQSSRVTGCGLNSCRLGQVSGAGSFEHGTDLSGSVEGGKLSNKLGDYQFLRKDSVPWLQVFKLTVNAMTAGLTGPTSSRPAGVNEDRTGQERTVRCRVTWHVLSNEHRSPQCVFTTWSTVILSSPLRIGLQSGFFRYRFTANILNACVVSLMRAVWPANLIVLDLITLNYCYCCC